MEEPVTIVIKEELEIKHEPETHEVNLAIEIKSEPETDELSQPDADYACYGETSQGLWGPEEHPSNVCDEKPWSGLQPELDGSSETRLVQLREFRPLGDDESTNPQQPAAPLPVIPLQCPICPSSFATAKGAKIHIDRHTVGNPFQCTLCSKSFCLEYQLRNHSRFDHSFVCSLCYKSFRTQHQLNGHLRIHQLAKCLLCTESNCTHWPKHCVVCDCPCGTQNALTKHLRLHNGKNRFQCTLCPKSNCEHWPKKCTICDHHCASNSALTKHMRLHSSKNQFKCTLCPKSYSLEYQLTNHLRFAHRMISVLQIMPQQAPIKDEYTPD